MTTDEQARSTLSQHFSLGEKGPGQFTHKMRDEKDCRRYFVGDILADPCSNLHVLSCLRRYNIEIVGQALLRLLMQLKKIRIKAFCNMCVKKLRSFFKKRIIPALSTYSFLNVKWVSEHRSSGSVSLTKPFWIRIQLFSDSFMEWLNFPLVTRAWNKLFRRTGVPMSLWDYFCSMWDYFQSTKERTLISTHLTIWTSLQIPHDTCFMKGAPENYYSFICSRISRTTSCNITQSFSYTIWW